jgi:4-methylaminobutanoate oxidase (formaldehyde-forming)
MYDRLQNEDGMSFDWKKTGSLRLAANEDRLLEARRLTTMAQSFDLEMSMIGPSEAKELFPLIEQKELLGAAFIPSDGTCRSSIPLPSDCYCCKKSRS